MSISWQIKDKNHGGIQFPSDGDKKSTITDSFQRVEEAFRLYPALLVGLSDVAIPLPKRQAALRDAWQASLHPSALNILLILQEQGLLNEIVATHHEVIVKTAVPLQEGQRQKLTELLQNKLGGTHSLQEHVDPSILGGLFLQIGYWQLDVSLQGKIDRLNRCLTM